MLADLIALSYPSEGRLHLLLGLDREDGPTHSMSLDTLAMALRAGHYHQ